MLIGKTPRSFARVLARSRRWKLSSLYQQRTSSSSEKSPGCPRAVMKPRAWLDHGMSGICVFVNHWRERASDTERQPAQTGSTIRARLKLLLKAAKPANPCDAAHAFASSTRSMDQFEAPKMWMRPAFWG